MLTGFNHNLRHKDTLYHVQTEDGGLHDPMVITQLFLGGQLLAQDIWTYTHLIGTTPIESISPMVLERMKSQHKGMLRRVVNGEFDRQADSEGPHKADPFFPKPLGEAAAKDTEIAEPVPIDTQELEEIDAELTRREHVWRLSVARQASRVEDTGE